MLTALLRTIVLYLMIIIGIRLMGKRQVGELEPSEFVLTLLIADLASVPMQDYGIPLLSGVIPILTLLALTMMISVLTMKSIRFRAAMCGRPSIVVRDGVPDQAEMRKNRFTIDELAEELRIQGVTDITQVKYAILETNGQMSVLLHALYQPATARDVHGSARECGLPVILINDGRLMEENLRARGLDKEWLGRQVERHGAKSPRELFLLSIDEAGEVYAVKKEVRR